MSPVVRAGASATMAFLALLAAVLVGSSPGASGASAPVYGNGPNGDFWTVPAAPTRAADGQLLYYNLSVVTQLDDAVTWTVAYVSTDVSGNKVVVTGTVAVPIAPWSGPGPRPVVDFAPGTMGMGPQCAPSREFAAGADYEDLRINAFLGAGYAVLLTDYQWGGTNGTPPITYMVGLAEGHDVLDMATAALQLPGDGLTAANPVIAFGYSQGGGAAVEAGELWRSYAPGVHLVGVAAGGVPGDLPEVAGGLDGSSGAGMLFMAVMGFHSAYPGLPYASLMTPTGASVMAGVAGDCIVPILLGLSGKSLSDYTVGGLTLAQVITDGNWKADLVANSPGLTDTHVPVPVFDFGGTDDEWGLWPAENTTYANLCSTGSVVQSFTLPIDHILGELEYTSQVLAFMGARFAGDAPTDSCLADPSTL